MATVAATGLEQSTAFVEQNISVVDIFVILQVEFQQSKMYVWNALQIQFCDRVF